MLLSLRRGLPFLLLILAAPAGLQAGVEQAGGAAAMEWTGTIVVEEAASGSLKGGAASIGFTARKTATYSVNGDGTATWQGSYSSNTDMGGFYKIPSTGSGGGYGSASVTFNGQGWDIYAEADDEMAVSTDYTGEDRAQMKYGLGAMAVEIAKAMGTPIGTLPPRVERESVGVPGASVPARGGENAISLNGTASETVPGGADQLGGPGTIPMTVTISWNLTKGPARSHVKIYGPECGCLDPDATEKTLHFRAGASPAGGEFSEFIVTSDGPAPEITSNTGGQQATLEISGTKDTGTVTLKVRYRRNGTTSESAPVTVQFCAIDKITLEDGDEHDLGFDLDGKLVVEAKSKLWRGGKDASAELEWDLDKMGSPTTLKAEPEQKKGDHIKFTYENMPKANSDFGQKTLTAKVGGTCACQQQETVRTFFPDVDSNHPEDGTPNWYYYWKQTAAAQGPEGMLKFQADVTDPNTPGEALARYDQQSQKILMSDHVFGKGACRDQVDPETHAKSGRHAEGIDCFGETVRHELQHRTDAIDWWGGPGGPYEVSLLDWFTKDWDHDQVPNNVEDLLAGCKPGTPLDAGMDAAKLVSRVGDLIANGKQTWFTCKARPFDDVTDAEINAYYKGWTWPIGSTDGEDWSCGDLSKQWHGKRCGK